MYFVKHDFIEGKSKKKPKVLTLSERGGSADPRPNV